MKSTSTPLPPGWNKTPHDLLLELSTGKRNRLCSDSDEFQWAVQYERSLLPLDTIFPARGQIWEAVIDCDVRIICVFDGQPGRCSTARLPQGERVWIQTDCEQPLDVTFQPLRHAELHAALVAADVREQAGYRYYLLNAKTVFFIDHFRLIAQGAEPLLSPEGQ